MLWGSLLMIAGKITGQRVEPLTAYAMQAKRAGQLSSLAVIYRCRQPQGGENSHKCELKQKMPKKYALKEN